MCELFNEISMLHLEVTILFPNGTFAKLMLFAIKSLRA